MTEHGHIQQEIVSICIMYLLENPIFGLVSILVKRVVDYNPSRILLADLCSNSNVLSDSGSYHYEAKEIV